MRDVIAGLNHFIEYADKTRRYADAEFYEDCKAEIEQLRARLAEVKTERAADLRKPFEGIRGCGDHSCLIETPDDLGTNGGCRCHNDRTKASIIVQRLAFLRRQAEDD